MTRPTFTIRDLLWLFLVLGLACAWFVDRSRLDYYATPIREMLWSMEETQADSGEVEDNFGRFRITVSAQRISELHPD